MRIFTAPLPTAANNSSAIACVASRVAICVNSVCRVRYCEPLGPSIPGANGATGPEALPDSGAVTLIQRFGSAANLNIHLHCLALDRVYRLGVDGTPEFVEVVAPTDEELQAVLHKIITRTMKLLTRRGVLVEEEGSTSMADNDSDSDEARALRPLQAAACTYRIAFGPRARQKLLTVQGAMPTEKGFKQTLCADMQGFSLHAAVRYDADDRQALEQLCRYITHPALANERVQAHAVPPDKSRSSSRSRRRCRAPGDATAGAHAAADRADSAAPAAAGSEARDRAPSRTIVPPSSSGLRRLQRDDEEHDVGRADVLRHERLLGLVDDHVAGLVDDEVGPAVGMRALDRPALEHP